MIQANLADGRILEFPDGTDPAVIQEAVKKMISQDPAAQEQPSGAFAQKAATQRDPDALQAAFDAPLGLSPTFTAPPGTGETIASIVSGGIAEPAAGLAGLAALPFGGDVGAAKTVEAVKEGLTFTGGEESQKQLQAISELVPEPVAAAIKSFQQTGIDIGDAISEAGLPEQAAIFRGIFGAAPEAVGAVTGLKAPAIAARAPDITAKAAEATQQAAEVAQEAVKAGKKTAAELFEKQSPAKQRIARLIEEGVVDADIAKFSLTEAGKVVKDKVANEAITQGFDRGVISSIKQASKADKIKMSKMVSLMEKSKRNPESLQRPSDVVGDTLLSRIKVIRKANKSAGLRIDKVARSLKGKDIDLTDAVTGFSQTLDNLGVRLIDDGKGGVKPDFEISQLGPGDRGPIKEVIRQMNIQGQGPVDGFSAHRMKRIIDNNVTFGKTKTGLSGDAERALKSFRSSLDDALDNTFPEYDKVNTIFSETIGVLDSIQDAVGGKLNLTGGQADKALGTKLRSLLSNNQNRVNLLDAVDDIEKIARKHGAGEQLLIEGPGLGKDSLLKQILFADELDSRFGPVARTSLQGQFRQAVTDVGGALAEAKVSPVTAALKGGAALVDKTRGINDASAFKAMKELLRE